MLVINQDCNKFNFRVAAIICNEENNKVMIHKKIGHDFWLLPGGRMEMGEDTTAGIKRELNEELGIKEEVELLYIIEDFFELRGLNYHELCFYYKLNINQSKYNLNHEEEFNGLEGENYIFKWIPINEIDNYNFKPEILKNKIKNTQSDFEHIIINKSLQQ